MTKDKIEHFYKYFECWNEFSYGFYCGVYLKHPLADHNDIIKHCFRGQIGVANISPYVYIAPIAPKHNLPSICCISRVTKKNNELLIH